LAKETPCPEITMLKRERFASGNHRELGCDEK